MPQGPITSLANQADPTLSSSFKVAFEFEFEFELAMPLGQYFR